MWFLIGSTETWLHKGEVYLLEKETEGSCVRCAKMCLRFMCEWEVTKQWGYTQADNIA